MARTSDEFGNIQINSEYVLSRFDRLSDRPMTRAFMGIFALVESNLPVERTKKRTTTLRRFGRLSDHRLSDRWTCGRWGRSSTGRG